MPKIKRQRSDLKQNKLTSSRNCVWSPVYPKKRRQCYKVRWKDSVIIIDNPGLA